MITIEVDGVRVEANTEAEAKKELARLARARKKEDKERAQKCAAARADAERTGYELLRRKAAGENGIYLYYPENTTGFRPFRKAEFDWITSLDINGAEGGSAKLSHYGYRLDGALADGGGSVRAVLLTDTWGDGDRQPMFYAVGACGGEVVIVDLPGITADWFKSVSK